MTPVVRFRVWGVGFALACGFTWSQWGVDAGLAMCGVLLVLDALVDDLRAAIEGKP